MKKKKEGKYPEVVCGVLIINKKRDILLVKSSKWKDYYVVPGGHVDYGEEIKDAAEREALEEVGIKTKFVKMLTIQELIFPKEFYKKKHFIALDCLCKAISTKVKKDGREIKETLWINPKKALTLKLEPTTRKAIKIYLKTK